jgi:UDP-N-acetylglucosamine acyltransferase
MQVLREIDPTARVSPEAKVGSYCVVGPNVTIGPGTVLRRRVTVTGNTSIGSHNVFEDGCVLGAVPQDLKYKGSQTMLLIGHRNRLGRGVTAHVGTESGGYLTRIGDDNTIGDGVHVAHDCYIDNRTWLKAYVLLAGHIHVQDGAVIDQLVGVQHFVTVGRYSGCGQRTPIRRDVPPYAWFASEDFDWQGPPAVRGIHEQGLAAAKLTTEERKELRRALHELFDDESALQTKIEQLVNMGVEGEVAELCQFVQRSLQGVFGRHRELYRGQAPPEAETYLTPELRAQIARKLP